MQKMLELARKHPDFQWTHKKDFLMHVYTMSVFWKTMSDNSKAQRIKHLMSSPIWALFPMPSVHLLNTMVPHETIIKELSDKIFEGTP